MGIDNTLKLIEDNSKLSISIKNIYELPYELPYLMEEVLKLIEDDSGVKDSDKISMCYMLDMYFCTCYHEFNESLGLEKLIPFAKIEIYKVEAVNGLRYATEKEVLHGVKGLIPENIYPAGENTFKLLCLLQWTFCGRSYYLRNAGYKLTYDSSGKMLNTPLEAFNMCAVQLKELIDWVRNRNALEKALKIISKFKKAGGYKYATYESDEIEETVTVKQLIYNIINTFPRDSANPEYRKAFAMALSKHRNNKSLTPYELSQLRGIYEKYALDKDRAKLIEKSNAGQRNKLKEECDFILKNRDKLSSRDFVFKIIETMNRTGYVKCSQKQYKFIEEALDKIKELSTTTTKTDVISDDDIDASLDDMYDALNSGMFE